MSIRSIESQLRPNKYSTYDLLPPTSDFVFCRIFGSEKHKPVLISLLNAILKGRPHVKDVQIDPTEHKRTSIDGKTVVLDIKATIDDGTIVNVEMQCINTGSIFARSIYNQATIVRDNTIITGQSYDEIPKIISIWIMNESITTRKECMHEAVYMFKKNGEDDIEIMTDVTRHFFIELPKLDLEPQKVLNDIFSAWMAFIKDPKTIPQELLTQEPTIQEAFEELEYLSHDKQSRVDYNDRLKALCDFNSANKKSKEEGIEEGMEIGREEGMMNAKIEVARNLLNMGLSIKKISQGTGLPEEDIQEIQKKL